VPLGRKLAFPGSLRDCEESLAPSSPAQARQDTFPWFWVEGGEFSDEQED